MKQIKEQIRALIDKSLSETDTVEQFKCIEQCYNLCLQNALPSYAAYRKLIQFFIGEIAVQFGYFARISFKSIQRIVLCDRIAAEQRTVCVACLHWSRVEFSSYV